MEKIPPSNNLSSQNSSSTSSNLPTSNSVSLQGSSSSRTISSPQNSSPTPSNLSISNSVPAKNSSSSRTISPLRKNLPPQSSLFTTSSVPASNSSSHSSSEKSTHEFDGFDEFNGFGLFDEIIDQAPPEVHDTSPAKEVWHPVIMSELPEAYRANTENYQKSIQESFQTEFLILKNSTYQVPSLSLKYVPI